MNNNYNPIHQNNNNNNNNNDPSTNTTTIMDSNPLKKVMDILFDENLLADENAPHGLASATNADTPQWRQWISPACINNSKSKHHYTNGTTNNTFYQGSSNDMSLVQIGDIKPFLFDETHSLIWYKNTNLPTIQLRAAEHASMLMDMSLMCTLVCVSVDSFEERLWKQHPLEGEAITQRLQTTHNPVVFQRIKCKETSYNLKGLRFFVICFVWSEKSKEPMLINVSLSLHIESRKKSLQESQTPLGFSHPFIPETLSNNYERYSQSVNADTSDSFFEYYASCSIRHKILHPLFLFLKFPKSIKIYVDTNLGKNAKDWGSLFVSIQRSMYQFLAQKKEKNNNILNGNNSCSNNRSNVPIIGMELFVKCATEISKRAEKKEQMKVYHFVKPLIKEGLVQIYLDRKDVPQSMGEIVFEDQMRNDYKNVYSELIALKKQAELLQKQFDGTSSINDDDDDLQQQHQHAQIHNSSDSATGQKPKKCSVSTNNLISVSNKNSNKYDFELLTSTKRKSGQSDRTENNSHTQKNTLNSNNNIDHQNGTKKFHANNSEAEQQPSQLYFEGSTSQFLPMTAVTATPQTLQIPMHIPMQIPYQIPIQMQMPLQIAAAAQNQQQQAQLMMMMMPQHASAAAVAASAASQPIAASPFGYMPTGTAAAAAATGLSPAAMFHPQMQAMQFMPISQAASAASMVNPYSSMGMFFHHPAAAAAQQMMFTAPAQSYFKPQQQMQPVKQEDLLTYNQCFNQIKSLE